MTKRNTKHDSNSKTLIFLALIVGVIGLSIGFAAFSGLLTIEEEAYVKPDNKFFKVNFSSSATALQTDSIEPTKSATTIEATPANINNDSIPTITGIRATFTEPGQSVTYNFHTYNSGKYQAFLKSVVFNNIENETLSKKCIPIAGSNITEDLLTKACNDIKVSIKVKDTLFNSSNNNITAHTLPINTSEPIELKLEYQNNNNFVDGDFKIELGSISLNYSSID